MSDYVVVVVTRGVLVQGVYPHPRAALESLPEGTEYEPCPDPTKGYNGCGKDRELRIRVTTLYGWDAPEPASTRYSPPPG